MYNCVIRKKKLEAKVKKLEGNWHPVTLLVGAITLVRAIGVCLCRAAVLSQPVPSWL